MRDKGLIIFPLGKYSLRLENTSGYPLYYMHQTKGDRQFYGTAIEPGCGVSIGKYETVFECSGRVIVGGDAEIHSVAGAVNAAADFVREMEICDTIMCP